MTAKLRQELVKKWLAEGMTLWQVIKALNSLDNHSVVVQDDDSDGDGNCQ